ncbi:hypothetical protein [Mycobacterium syngnathidarum]
MADNAGSAGEQMSHDEDIMTSTTVEADTAAPPTTETGESPGAEQNLDSASDSYDTEDEEQAGDDATRRRWEPGLRTGIIVATVLTVLLGGLAGWQVRQLIKTRADEQRRQTYLQVGRQAALNLTTIDFATVDADIQRVLDASTGEFFDEFQSRSPAFAEVVRQAKAKSEGTINEAGIESIVDDGAQILVAASVKTSNAGVPEPEPRYWRMRITVRQSGTETKVSNVGFVP